MKTILLTVAALLFVAVACIAEPIHNPAGATITQLWSNYAGTASTAKYSAVQKADRNTKKAIILVGYSSSGASQLTTLPGTAVIQVAPTSSGPWVTAKDVFGNAMSVTSSGSYLIDSLNQWYRIQFTKTATDTKGISAWILYADN